jgi:O-acetyl-ADP-ribose deacetylase (regulator of RNase III)
VLRAVERKNREQPGAISTVACPGLGTGTGQMLPSVCARQMYKAYREIVLGQPFEPSGVNDALLQHYRLLRETD